MSLDPAAIQAKLVRGGRGGWCFEQNLLLFHVLTALGFEVKRLAARVRWNVPADVVTARSHCLMQVTVEGERYIADVGFGGLTLTAPLRLAPGIEQATPHEPHRIVEHGGIHSLDAKVAGEWQTLYTFELNEAQVADYEVSNWYLSNFPQSQFVNGIVVAGRPPACGTRFAITAIRCIAWAATRSGDSSRTRRNSSRCWKVRSAFACRARRSSRKSSPW